MKKNILAENMRRFNTKNLNEIGTDMPGFEGTWDSLSKLGGNNQKWDIHVNYVQVDTNFHDVTMQKQGTLDSHFLEDILGDLEAYLKDQNITGDDGHPSFDITRFVSDIKLDCEIKMGKDEIDLTIELDPDGSIKYVNIGDEPLAEKYGITDDSIIKHLAAEGI